LYIMFIENLARYILGFPFWGELHRSENKLLRNAKHTNI
jgi:hypothetical protein